MGAHVDEHTKREAARKLFMEGFVSAVVGGSLYYVESESKSGYKYKVSWDKEHKKWNCTCPDFVYHQNAAWNDTGCKHIIAVKMAIDSSQEIADTVAAAKNIKRKLTSVNPDEIPRQINLGNLEDELSDLEWKLIQDSLARTTATYLDMLCNPSLDHSRRLAIQVEHDYMVELLGRVALIRRRKQGSIQK